MSAVVQVITALERGGAQRIALETAAGLSRPGRPVFLLAGRGAALDDEARRRLGGRLRLLRHLQNPLSATGDIAALVELHRELSRLSHEHGAPLVVHTHSSKAGVLGRLAARAVPGAVVVHTVHGFGTGALGERARPFLEAAERVAGAATDALVFVCSADRARADRDRLAPAARRVVVPGFAAVAPAYDDDARAAARARFGVPAEAPLVVTVANLKPQKDPLLHVRTFAAFRARAPDARFVLAGDGPLRADVEEELARRGLRDAVSLPGFLEDPAPLYAAGDVYLLASAWEGLPMSVLEALAWGLPVAARDTGWVSDVDMPDRVVARRSDAAPAALAGAVAEALARGRAPADLPERFTRAGMLRALDELYEELASASTPNT